MAGQNPDAPRRGSSRKRPAVTAMSGIACPQSGEWEIAGPVSTSRVFAKGSIMPEYYGRKVPWILIRAG